MINIDLDTRKYVFLDFISFNSFHFINTTAGVELTEEHRVLVKSVVVSKTIIYTRYCTIGFIFLSLLEGREKGFLCIFSH